MSRSIIIKQTQIKPGLRVSSAAIHYDEYHGDRWQYETWIFGDPAVYGSRQVIHGNALFNKGHCDRLKATAEKYHRRIVRVLKQGESNE